MKKKVLLLGRGTIAVNCLNILSKHNVLPKVIVCDTKDAGVDTWTKSLYKCACNLGYKENINVLKQTKVNSADFINLLKKTAPDIDIILSIQPYAIFRMPFIQLAKDYVVNLHFAPLPKLRGVAPCSWAIEDELKSMGVTLHLIQDEGIDNGPIIYQKLFPIEENDTAGTLYDKCIQHGTKLFKKNVHNILTHTVEPHMQNEKEATYHPMNAFDFSAMEIIPSMSVKQALKFARARIFPVFQTPYFIYNGKRYNILSIIKTDKAVSKTEITSNKYYYKLKDGGVMGTYRT